jgi:hypothetical protein
MCEVLLIVKTLVPEMCHILLAGYEDVPSFLNQWKLIERPEMIKMKTYLVYTV